MGRIAPQTTFKWNDRSTITPLIAADTGAPLILIAASTDKGGEDLVKISGSDFYKRYVTDQKLMYQRHGQPLLEAAALIDAGAELLFKRIVADDATMANAIVSVEVTKTVPAEEGGIEGITAKSPLYSGKLFDSRCELSRGRRGRQLLARRNIWLCCQRVLWQKTCYPCSNCF